MNELQLGTQRTTNTNNLTNHTCPMCSQQLAGDQGNPAGLDLSQLPPPIAGIIQQLLQLAQQMSQQKPPQIPDQMQPETMAV